MRDTNRPGASIALADLLRSAELFSSLLDDDIAYLATVSEGIRLEEGERLFSMGERANRFYFVRSGIVGVSKTVEGGRTVTMARFLKGDVIGDFDFAVGDTYDAVATAETPCELLCFPARSVSMESIALEKPDTAARILLRSLAMISGRLRATHRLIAENAPWVRELKRQIYTDSATGLHSRAFLEEEIPGLLTGQAALVFVKPDRFKELNDLYGHGAGDEAMSSLARLYADEIARLGKGWAIRLRSNETVLVVPDCGPLAARELAEGLARAMPGLDVSRSSGGLSFPFTMSAALAFWPYDGKEWRRVIEFGYGLLTKAWRGGGNRILDASSAEIAQ